jgi:SPP1 family predicted phage head-tail adaptor
MAQYPDFYDRIRAALPLDPGRLRHQVQIQRKAISGQNTRGEDLYTWETFRTVYAEVQALAGREFEAAQQRWPEARYQVRLQYLSGVECQMRILWWDDGKARSLDILDVQAGQRRDRLTLICRELTT